MDSSSKKCVSSGDAFFPSTCWGSLQPGPEATAGARHGALEELARTYAGPIRAFLRGALRRSEEESEELAQDFFVWTIESAFLDKADPRRGRFRAFLKTALRHYVRDSDRRTNTLKRGGGRTIESLEGAGEEEARPRDVEDAKTTRPEDALDEAWRAELVQSALDDVRARLATDGRERVYLVFREYFLAREPDVDYRQLAEKHGIKTTDVSNDLVRAKQLFRAALEARVRETVATPADLREEMSWLLGAPS